MMIKYSKQKSYVLLGNKTYGTHYYARTVPSNQWRSYDFVWCEKREFTEVITTRNYDLKQPQSFIEFHFVWFNN